jgi:hypothetical protein
MTRQERDEDMELGWSVRALGGLDEMRNHGIDFLGDAIVYVAHDSCSHRDRGIGAASRT